MGITYWKNVAEIASDLLSAGAIIVGGVWVWYRFGRTREDHPKVEFTIDFRPIETSGEHIVAGIACILVNRGTVRHSLSSFTFDLFVRRKGAPVVRGDEKIRGQVRLEKVLSDQSLIAPKMEGVTFVDPGVMQRYCYLAAIPADATLAQVNARFTYDDAESEFHTAQRAWRVGPPYGPPETET